MNCTETRELLPAYAYGDVASNLKRVADEHLASCPQCCGELGALVQLRRLLDVAPVANVDVDMRQIFAEANRRQQAQLRRWRRVAYVTFSAAAALLIAFLLRFEASWEGRQLVVRFGVPSADLAEKQSHVVVEKQPVPLPRPEVTAADLRLVKDLVHNLAATVDQRNSKFQETLAQLEFELNQVQEVARTRWAATERYVSALSASQMDTHTKGER